MVSACARNRFGSEQQRTKRRRDSLQTDEPFAVIAEERLPAHIFCLLPGVDYNIRKALNCRVRNLMETDMAVYRRCFQMLRLQIRLRRGGRRDDNICSFGRHVQRFRCRKERFGLRLITRDKSLIFFSAARPDSDLTELRACIQKRLKLVLSLSAGVIYHRLLQRITGRNGVPAEPTTPRVLGPDICVPYGKILRGVAVPNTVTKTLRTDKVYEPDLSSYSIEAYPDYSPLEDQVRTIRAFDRPAILVDDVLHDGKRIRRLDPLLRRTGTEVKKVLVGYLTGTGRDLMESLGYDAEGVYYLPNLRMRFVESTLYPFIGGDTIRRSQRPEGGLQPSVNRVLPYASPEFSPLDPETAWALSLCCVENARNILLALETEYRRAFARNLTLSRLSEAVILPLCPDKGGSMAYDLSRGASTYLDDDIELLKRMRFGRKETTV